MAAPVQISPTLWIMDGPVVDWFFPFPTRMTIARLPGGGLFIHSPIELNEEVRKAVDALGSPRYFVSPNKLHHLFWSEWQAAYPNAQSFSPPQLAEKRPDLAFHGELGDTPHPGWAPQIDQLLFKGSRFLEEVVFFHKDSRTVIFGDLVERFDAAPLTRFQRFIALVGGVMAPRGGTPIDYRFSFFLRRAQGRDSLRRIIEWDPERLVMCHGVPVLRNALPFIESAFAWLGQK